MNLTRKVNILDWIFYPISSAVRNHISKTIWILLVINVDTANQGLTRKPA